MDAERNLPIKITFIRGKYQYKLACNSKHNSHPILKGSLTEIRDIILNNPKINIQGLNQEILEEKLTQGYTHLIIGYVSDISR